MDEPDDSIAIRRAAMDLLARREHSRDELLTKLSRRFSDSAAVAEQVDILSSENLQSDSRFARSFLRQRAERGYGPRRIRLELEKRGVEDSAIDSAFEEHDIDWREHAREVLQKKFGSKPSPDLRERARRYRFLQYRGFDGEDVGRVLDH